MEAVVAEVGAVSEFVDVVGCYCYGFVPETPELVGAELDIVVVFHGYVEFVLRRLLDA